MMAGIGTPLFPTKGSLSAPAHGSGLAKGAHLRCAPRHAEKSQVRGVHRQIPLIFGLLSTCPLTTQWDICPLPGLSPIERGLG
jgi:hypothetical protein